MRDLTEDEVLAAILSCGVELQGRIALTFDSGPCEVTKPTVVALRLASEIQRKFREVNATGVDASESLNWPPRHGIHRFVVEITSAKPVERWAVLNALHYAKLALRTDIAVDPVSPEATLTAGVREVQGG